jgi:hypothetical protein
LFSKEALRLLMSNVKVCGFCVPLFQHFRGMFGSNNRAL